MFQLPKPPKPLLLSVLTDYGYAPIHMTMPHSSVPLPPDTPRDRDLQRPRMFTVAARKS